MVNRTLAYPSPTQPLQRPVRWIKATRRRDPTKENSLFRFKSFLLAAIYGFCTAAFATWGDPGLKALLKNTFLHWRVAQPCTDGRIAPSSTRVSQRLFLYGGNLEPAFGNSTTVPTVPLVPWYHTSSSRRSNGTRPGPVYLTVPVPK